MEFCVRPPIIDSCRNDLAAGCTDIGGLQTFNYANSSFLEFTATESHSHLADCFEANTDDAAYAGID